MKADHFLPLSPADHKHLLDVARALLGNPADAEDAVHETYLRAMTTQPEPLDTPLAWLTTVLRHLAIDTLRKRRRRAGADMTTTLPDMAPSAEALAENAQALRHALRWLSDHLSPHEAAVLLLREIFEENHTAIAARTGKSEAACRQAAHRALVRLRSAPSEHDPNDRATADALYTLCLRALQAHSTAPLYAILASPVKAQAVSAEARSRTPTPAAAGSSLHNGIVSVNGGYALVLWHEGRLLCCMELGPLGTPPAELDSLQPVMS